MPDPSPNIVRQIPAKTAATAGAAPEPFTCEWAKAGLAAALDGMSKAGGGVTEYHIGSRGLHRSGPEAQIKNVDYWNEMVKLYCGESLPSSLTGRDSARRVVMRDT